MEVNQVLKIDSESRVPGIQGDLHLLENIKQKDWDYSLPTLAKNLSVFSKDKPKTDLQLFKASFFKEHPILEKINWNNVLVAGGSVGGHVYGRANFETDVDFFIYGLSSVKEAEDKIKEIYDVFVNEEIEKSRIKHERIEEERKKSHNPHNNPLIVFKPKEWHPPKVEMLMIKTRNCLTIAKKYQIIFRLYSSISEILHGFDLGSSAIGFNGQEVYLTSLGKFAYEYGCNIIDTTRRSISYEFRLQKYFLRGFDIIMPQLDIKKVPTLLWDQCENPDPLLLPRMFVKIEGTSGNRIHFSGFIKKIRKKSNESDYVKFDYFDEYALFYSNLKHILRQEYDKLVFCGNNYEQVYSEDLCFSRARVNYFYDSVVNQLNGANFPVRKVEKYIVTDTPEEIFLSRKDAERLKGIIEENKKIIFENLSNISKDKSYWVTKNPGSQLCGSFNPIIEDPKEWYGDYFKNHGSGGLLSFFQ